ncbi:MAG: GNAT family N-acetyltransferase, partial [Chloroflexi bacterium]|nr:GNAT family N-acetyltransferase [Chloroflexota bacterium]
MKSESGALATGVADRAGVVVASARLEMRLMPALLLDALLARDRASIGRIAGYTVPDAFPAPEDLPFLRFRREQLARDPARYPWSVRAIVRTGDRKMVGFVNFHGAPGVNDVGAADALELGWSVFPEERERGYATEAARALMEWAGRAYGITHFISST